MITLSYKESNLVLDNTRRSVEFNIKDAQITNVIKKNLDKSNGCATLSVQTLSNEYILVLNNSIRLRVSARVGFEIYSRVLLLKM